jgi:hypothetical protein
VGNLNWGYRAAVSPALVNAAHVRREEEPASYVSKLIAMMLAMRQTALSDTTRAHSTWPSEATLRHLAHTASAIIEAPEEDDGAMPTALGVTG